MEKYGTIWKKSGKILYKYGKIWKNLEKYEKIIYKYRKIWNTTKNTEKYSPDSPTVRNRWFFLHRL